jgi:hypothetical protein
MCIRHGVLMRIRESMASDVARGDRMLMRIREASDVARRIDRIRRRSASLGLGSHPTSPLLLILPSILLPPQAKPAGTQQGDTLLGEVGPHIVILVFITKKFLRVREIDDWFRTVHLRLAYHAKGDIYMVLYPELQSACSEQGNRMSPAAVSLINFYGIERAAQLVDATFVAYESRRLELLHLVAPMWDNIERLVDHCSTTLGLVPHVGAATSGINTGTTAVARPPAPV